MANPEHSHAEQFSEQVRECLRRAEESAQRAKVEPDPALARDFLDMERRWLSLARSYQFAEQVETFTNHNKKRLDDAAKVVDLRTQGHGD
jgi:hypothetical protein